MTRFLVDAQLPRRLAHALQEAGLDAVHTLDLPAGNATKDGELNALSLREKRVLVTKDADFVQSYTLQGRPYKLLLASTGNISNQALLALFMSQLTTLVELFEEHSFIELAQSALVIHS